ncbi:hypothetical protein D3C77_446340 [compost metagenome]
MDVAGALFGHAGHVAQLTATGQVVMAHEQSGISGEGEYALDRAIQRAGAGTGEVATGGAVVGHEQGVADKGDALAIDLHHIGHACRGVPRGVQRARLQRADGKSLLIVEQHIELTAIAGEATVGIEQRAEDFLHLGDLATDCNLPTQRLFEVGRGGQVIGVYMGFQYPLDLATERFHPAHQLVRRRAAGAPGLGIVIQDTVDQCTVSAATVHHQIADGRSHTVEQCLHIQVTADDHYRSPDIPSAMALSRVRIGQAVIKMRARVQLPIFRAQAPSSLAARVQA